MLQAKHFYYLVVTLSVRDVNQYLKLDLPEDAGYTTIAGFLMDRAGKVMQRGDHVNYEGYVFEVERVEKRRITRIRLTPHLSEDNERRANLPSLLGASVLASHTASSWAASAESVLPYLAI